MGEARRRQLAGHGPKLKQPIPAPGPPRSPEEVEAEIAAREVSNARYYGTIAAALDFIHSTSEDALRQQTRHILGSSSQETQCKKVESLSPISG